MRRFTDLYTELDRTTRTNEKVAAMVDYFRAAPPADAAWAVRVLSGEALIRRIPGKRLRAWASAATGFPVWLIDESYDSVGDLSETIALLLGDGPDADAAHDAPLAEVIERSVLPLPKMDEAAQHDTVTAMWRRLDRRQKFLYHKLLGGVLRVGVSRKLVVRALAEVAEIDPAVMAHRMTGRVEPTAEAYAALMADEGAHDPGRPYPFYLASPLEADPSTLGDPADWQLEWKWDGIRAQLLRRGGQTLLWSRGEELVTAAFPEIAAAGDALPEGTVLDGEIVAWERERPLPFALLQRRINRKRHEPMLFDEVPVAFLAYDVLEADGADIRERPLTERRALLDALVCGADDDTLRCSPIVETESWDALGARVDESRERGVEGLMLKRRVSPYRVGRVRGDWWKWKVDPYTIDAVLIMAQRGSGKRAGLFTDYTFGVWADGELVPVAKAYSGLSNDEIAGVDRFIRNHTVERYGPVNVVKPDLVFELAFEDIAESTRHKAGLALRFPRMIRQRTDKRPDEADMLENVRAIFDRKMERAHR